MPTTHKRRSHGRVIGRRCQRYSPAKTRYERWTARDKKRPMPSLLAVALVESVRFPLVEGLRFDKVAPPQFGREQKKTAFRGGNANAMGPQKRGQRK